MPPLAMLRQWLGRHRPELMALLWLVVIAGAWAVLRLEMTREHKPANWAALVELRAPLPFGHRILVPMVARAFVHAGASVRQVFFASEWLAAITLVLVLRRALRADLDARAATLGATLILPILSFALLLAHHWPMFYPWDLWAAALLVATTDAARRKAFGWATLGVAIGAYNRESIILMPGFVLVMHLDVRPLRQVLAWSALMLVVYTTARASIPWLAPRATGESLHLWLHGQLRLTHNLLWLTDLRQQAQWWGSMALAPFWWLWVRRWAPRDLWRLHLPCLVGWAGLMVVANVYEPRVYGELMTISWWVAWVGLWRWARGDGPIGRAAGWPSWVDRCGAAVLLAIAAIIGASMVQWATATG